jgi:hypothetical protein
MMARQELSEVQGLPPQDAVAEEPAPITMTGEELRALVRSLVSEQFAALGLEGPTPDVAMAPAAPAPDPDRPPRPGEREMEGPMASDQGAPGLVPVYVLQPLRENGADYLPGASFRTTPERAERLATLGLATPDVAEFPLAPPSAPEPPSVPRKAAMIWRER